MGRLWLLEPKTSGPGSEGGRAREPGVLAGGTSGSLALASRCLLHSLRLSPSSLFLLPVSLSLCLLPLPSTACLCTLGTFRIHMRKLILLLPSFFLFPSFFFFFFFVLLIVFSFHLLNDQETSARLFGETRKGKEPSPAPVASPVRSGKNIQKNCTKKIFTTQIITMV